MPEQANCFRCGKSFQREMMGPYYCPTCDPVQKAEYMQSDEYKKLYDSHGNQRVPLLKRLAQKMMLPGSYRDPF